MSPQFPPEATRRGKAMFSVIFEVHPNDGRKDDYLELAKHLKPILETIDEAVDRFQDRLEVLGKLQIVVLAAVIRVNFEDYRKHSFSSSRGFRRELGRHRCRAGS